MTGRARYPNLSREVLDVIRKADRPLTLAELAEAVGVSQQNVYYSIKKLCAKKSVRCIAGDYPTASHRYALGIKLTRDEQKPARYIPPFRPRVFDAAQCPMVRAELCLLIRR